MVEAFGKQPLLESLPEKTHMEMVSALKEQHGIGDGHANALVAYFRKR